MNYRHGDMALISIDNLPKELIKSDSKILMIGSNNNTHSYNKGEFYLCESENKFIIGYFKAFKDTELYHKSHGDKTNKKNLKVAKIKPGFYELRKQHENTHDGMQPVLD